MTEKADFPSRYHTSEDVEALQSSRIHRHLRALWAIHHDDYAPEGQKLTFKPLGGNSRAVTLIGTLQKVSLREAQQELDRLNGPSL